MCTGIRLTAEDRTVVNGRTMEFGFDLKSEVMVSPPGYRRTGITPEGGNGLIWTATYATVGATSERVQVWTGRQSLSS